MDTQVNDNTVCGKKNANICLGVAIWCIPDQEGGIQEIALGHHLNSIEGSASARDI